METCSRPGRTPGASGYGAAVRRLGLLLVACFLTLGSVLWWQGTRGEDWGRAPDGLPVLRDPERERVTFLRTQDWCQAYADGSGVRANTLTGTCTLRMDGGARLFDAAIARNRVPFARTGRGPVLIRSESAKPRQRR